MRTFLSIVILGALTVGTFPLGAYAHGDVDHSTEVEAQAHTELTDTQMRIIIALLQKLVVILQTQADVANAREEREYNVPIAPSVIPMVSDGVGEMETHHEEHGANTEQDEEEPDADILRLRIEVEAHYENTHVHVRYVDKPEAMFFVEAPLTDENAIVNEIKSKTGLTEAEVRAAIVYLGQ